MSSKELRIQVVEWIVYCKTMSDSDISAIVDELQKDALQVIVSSIKKPNAQVVSLSTPIQSTVPTKELLPSNKFKKIKEILKQLGPSALKAQREPT